MRTWIVRSRTVALAAVAVAGLVSITSATPGAASEIAQGVPEASPAEVPAALRPPAGHVPVGSFAASGVQVYRCASGAWTFVEPAAALAGTVRGARRLHTAIHFRGPSWESTVDGSLVEAAAVASSPVAGSIPQLLLQARTTRGDGVFGRVTYIQRLATSGGAAPAGGCADGATTGVPYRADYRFFVAAP